MKQSSKVKIVGQKFARFKIIPINLNELVANKAKDGVIFGGFKQQLLNQIDIIWTILEKSGFDISDRNMLLFRSKYLKEEVISNSDKRNFIEKYKFFDHCTMFVLYAEIALSTDIKTEHRLEQAYKAGAIYKTIEVLAEFNESQKKAAKALRKKDLAEIFTRLKRQKLAGETPKELWPQFISALENESQSFEDVLEHRANEHNIKSWYVTFLAINNEFKPNKINYMNFARRLGKP